MIRSKVGLFIAVVGISAGMNLGRAVAAPAVPPPVPAPTDLHPLQGLRRLTVATLPSVPGMQFAIDGAVFTADAQGVASILVTKAQRESMRAARDQHLTVVTPLLAQGTGVRARFTGWSGTGVYRSGRLPEDYQRATFDIEYLTNFAFVARAGRSVDTATLTSMQLASSLGRRITLTPPHPVWLQGSRTTTGALGLQSRAVSYRIDSVTTSGANAVHRGQRQFFPSRNQDVTVALLLFDVRISARDALLGGGTGSGVTVEYPDGHLAHLRFGPNGSVTARRLPRGSYHLTINGSGPALSQKLTVSKTQTADIDTVTWIDIGLGLVLLLGIAAALLVVRRTLRRRGIREAGLVGDEREEPRELVRTQ